jgi:hypothetical protein
MHHSSVSAQFPVHKPAKMRALDPGSDLDNHQSGHFLTRGAAVIGPR